MLVPLAKQFPAQGAQGLIHGRLHSFRHYFCSTCANAGTPEQVLMDWLGHRDSRMVRHYFHLHETESRRHMNKINFVADAADATVAGPVRVTLTVGGRRSGITPAQKPDG